jgi:thioredoxin 1
MTELLSSTGKKAAALIAMLPLAAGLAGCVRSATPLGGTSSAGTASLSTEQSGASNRGDTPDAQHALAQDREQNSSATHSWAPPSAPSPPSAELVSTARSNPSLFPPAQPQENQTMTNMPHAPRTHGKVEHIGSDDFQQHVLDADVPVLVDFYADWCGPCRALAPVLDQVAQSTPHAKVVKVNIDDSPQLASRYGISSIPTLLVFKDGAAVAQHTGLADQHTLQRLLTR